jgi:methionine synthase II (cobalamin-independent)
MAGQLSAEELGPLEDRAIREVVALQEALGLRSITDGEFRRQTYLLDFLQSIGVKKRKKRRPVLSRRSRRKGFRKPRVNEPQDTMAWLDQCRAVQVS